MEKTGLVFGNDGGIAIVRNGLAAYPKIASLNGDLSINLLHAFDIHEETGRTLFAFQDHKMVYRDPGNNYSTERFLHEGAFAMIQQHYPDAMVGAAHNSIQDEDSSSHPIVAGFLYSYPFPGYHQHYRHYPERFIAGLKNGKIGMNRAANVSEYSDISFFGSDEVGAVAICQRKPEFIYAARNSGREGLSGSDVEHLVKSINDADPNDPNTWIPLSSSLVSLPIYSDPFPLQNLVAWKGIRAIAVDHFNENLVYCGINKVYTHYTDTILDEVFRVIKSTTGGMPDPANDNIAWIDYSQGLPAFPVERLLTVESDNELIFCATSVGIYYRTKTMEQWECFSKGLPFAEITGLKYDYCNNVLYASTYGRGLWKTEVNIPIVNSYSEIIDENQTWEENRTIYTGITVETGNTLTITGIIRMATGTNIIVEPGATLILNGGTLTNACGGVWKGIKVYGNRNLTQAPATHGRLILKNNAVIENAANAVTLWKTDDWSTTGGIIQASHSTFRNNKRAVEFLSFQNQPQPDGYVPPNKSYFANCTFEINDDYLIPEEGNKQMITMYDVNGVRIMGCDFKYTRNVSSYTELKAAIYTIDANFNVGNYVKRSTFTGFNKAIHATGGAMNVGPEIKNALFSKNMVGIAFEGVVTPKAIYNQFIVGNNQFPPFYEDNPNFHLGIKVENCDEYIVEENEFIGNDSLGWATHGVYTYDENYSGNSNEIYNNEYSNMSSATIAAGIHADPTNDHSFIGLRFVCNQNEYNINDFEVRPFEGVYYSQISSFQNGGGNLPAGNTFSGGNTGDNIYTHLDFNSNATYVYVKNINDTDPEESEIRITPGDIYVSMTAQENTCLTNYPLPNGGIDRVVLYDPFNNTRIEYENLFYAYLILIDNGNTEGMISEIDLSWPNDAWTLHAELMSRSPYNSETVLIAAADRNILTHGMLLEILLTNPDALRSGEVLIHVQFKISNPMPQYMIDILREAACDPNTVRSGMEKNLSNLHLEMIRNHKRIIHEHLNDTISGFHPDTLIKYFSSIKSLAGRYQQIFAYTGLNQYVNARAVMDSISFHYRLSNEQTSELSNTADFIDLLESVHGDRRNIAQLNPNEITDLENISKAEPGGIAAQRAKNILCFFYEKCADEWGAPKSNNPKPNKPKVPKETLENALNHVKVAPNPANTYIEFEYDIFKTSKENTLRIIDVQGKPIKVWNLGGDRKGIKVLDTRNLLNGVYFYELLQDGSKLKGGKFIVQH